MCVSGVDVPTIACVPSLADAGYLRAWKQLLSNQSTTCQSCCLEQGYRPGEVVILTPYVGQLLLIRRQLGRFMTVVLSDRDLEDLPEDDVDNEASPSQCAAQRHTH